MLKKEVAVILRSIVFFEVLGKNFSIAIFWHLIITIISIYVSVDFFDYRKRLYKIRSWERGDFYVKWLKIKLWKDKLPQFVLNGGFSKKHLIKFTKISKEYLEKFLVETCRAEWNHLMCSLSGVVLCFFYKDLFFVVPIILNLPFICVQRFNRIRLLSLRSRILSKIDKSEIMRTAKVSSLS